MLARLHSSIVNADAEGSESEGDESDDDGEQQHASAAEVLYQQLEMFNKKLTDYVQYIRKSSKAARSEHPRTRARDDSAGTQWPQSQQSAIRSPPPDADSGHMRRRHRTKSKPDASPPSSLSIRAGSESPAPLTLYSPVLKPVNIYSSALQDSVVPVPFASFVFPSSVTSSVASDVDSPSSATVIASSSHSELKASKPTSSLDSFTTLSSASSATATTASGVTRDALSSRTSSTSSAVRSVFPAGAGVRASPPFVIGVSAAAGAPSCKCTCR